jgi:hypothetical protein
MADTPTTRNRLRKQEVGAKTNAWGGDLNEDGGSDRLDESLDGVTSFTLSGSKTLTSVNYETDEARKRMINVTGGTGGTVTIPALEKFYLVRNGASGTVAITNGSNSVNVVSGEVCDVFTDGTGIYKSNNKDYVDAAILNASISGSLPAQAGNNGKFIQTDGANASWQDVEPSDIFGLTGVLAGKQDLDTDLTAIAALAPSNDDLVQRKGGVWTNRTVAQLLVDLGIAGLTASLASKQPLDTDLTDFAALSPSNDDIAQRKAGAWASRTMAQLLVDLAAAGAAKLTDLLGLQEIPIPASAMTARLVNGPAQGLTETTTNKVMLATLDYDPATTEYAQIRFPMPKRWNEGTVTAQFEWTAAATGNVVWACRAVAISDDDPVDAAFGTAQTVTDAVTAANDFMKSAKTSAITIGGSPAEGDMVIFEFYRDAASGSDTLNSNDARLLAVVLSVTTDAKDDT